jgi:hypothetical protein
MPLFYALPFDDTAPNFYFRSREEYESRTRMLTNKSGQPVTEFEIQFIDGSVLDAYFADAFELSQANLFRFLELVETWSEDQKRRFIVAVSECGYSFDPGTVDPDDFEVAIYPAETLRALAEQFVGEGRFGKVPKALRSYIDYDAIARDLADRYTPITIGGAKLVYHCGRGECR